MNEKRLSRLTEEELIEHYGEEIKFKTTIPEIKRLHLNVGQWYPYSAVSHFNDVVPCKNNPDSEIVKRMGLEEYPPLFFRYNGGEFPWTQAIDSKIMYIDRYKYMCYHEEDYAQSGLDWLCGAKEEMSEVLLLIADSLRKVDENDWKTIDYLKQLEDEINYKVMCYEGAMSRVFADMEEHEAVNRQRLYENFGDYMNEPIGD